MKSLSRVWLFKTPWTVACQAPLSMRFSRQEYWSGLPFPSPGDLPNPGIEPGSSALQADSLLAEPWEKSPIKKAECQRIDAFELWSWRRLLRVHWTARRSYQSILKEISPEYSLAGLMLRLKLQYFGHLMQSTDSLEKTEDGMVGWHHWLDGHGFEEAPGVGDGQGSLACCSPWGYKELDMTERLNWAEPNPYKHWKFKQIEKWYLKASKENGN